MNPPEVEFLLTDPVFGDAFSHLTETTLQPQYEDQEVNNAEGINLIFFLQESN